MSYIYYTIYNPLGHILKVVQDNYSRPNGKWYTIKTLDNNSHHTSGPGICSHVIHSNPNPAIFAMA